MGYFDNLNLDNWFKSVTYIGGIIAILSLTVPLQILSNEVLAAIGFGAFLYGIGRWKNQKTITNFVPGGKISHKERVTDLLGLFLEASGIVLISGALIHIARTTL